MSADASPAAVTPSRRVEVSLYDEVTTKIIAQLEAGRLPRVQPWGRAGGAALSLPRNGVTGRRGVRQDELDRADVHADRHRPCAFAGTAPAEGQKAFPIQFRELLVAEIEFEACKCGDLGSAGRLTHFLHVRDMQIDEVAEGVQTRDA